MNLQITVLFITAILNGAFSYFLIRGKKSALKSLFSLFVLSVGMWSLGLALFIETKDLDLAFKYSAFYYISPAIVVLTFLYFSLSFLKDKVNKWVYLYVLIPFLVLVISFVLDKNLIIKEIYFINEATKGVVLNKLNYIYYMIYMLVYIGVSYYILLKARTNKGVKQRTQLNFIIAGTSISYVFAMIFNLFLPYFGNYSMIWLGPPFTIIMVATIAYAILKHGLFSNAKIWITEIVVMALWVILSIELFLADSVTDIVVELIVIILVIIFGILLIRGVSREIKRREETEKIAKELMEANARLKKLDQEKSDFISIASHQLRTPLTAIKGYASMIAEGTYGDMPKKAKDVVDKIFQSSQRLVYIVNDMLDVSRIEKGKIKYSFEDIKIAELVKDICDELKVNATSKKLKFTVCIKDEDKDIVISADYGKLRQAITNIIDNAIKYTDMGFVMICLERDKDGKNMILSVKDSGIGMDQESLRVAFEKFERAKNAQKTHTEGSGLGLYVAKEIIKANGGVIWATSDGVGKGSQFYIEFPIKEG